MLGNILATWPFLIAHIKLPPITEAGGLCSSLNASLPPTWLDLPFSANSGFIDAELIGAAILVKPVVAW